LGLGAAYGFLFYPRQEQLRRLTAEVKGLEERLTLLQQAQSPRYREEQMQTLAQQRAQCEQLLFAIKDLNRLDFRLRELARDSQVQGFESRNVFEQVDKPVEKLKRIDQRKMMTQCKADFPQFLRFLNAMERDEPVLFVSQFGLSQTFDPGEKPVGHIEVFALHEKLSPVAKGN
jgi:hypothetical protein